MGMAEEDRRKLDKGLMTGMNVYVEEVGVDAVRRDEEKGVRSKI
jgi:hypothetical protein